MQDLTADVELDAVDVVFGVGAIEKLTTSYVGKSRDDVITDVLDDGDLIANRVLSEVIPPWRRDIHVPVFKYLREDGLLNPDGTLTDPSAVDERIAARVTGRATRLLPPDGYHRTRAKADAAKVRDFATLVEQQEPFEALMALAYIPKDKVDLDALRDYLKEHREDQHVNGHSLQASQWVKAVCIYDWLRYGRDG
ncbi:MAG: hypothetical protein H0U79_01590 [Solirubrobacterales bacterium]|nr:hypothetical protein [Solirubrobacterales bacterium]